MKPPDKLTIRVTQNHIDKGRPEDCGRCPVALAVLDALPDVRRVYVDGDIISVRYARKDHVYWCPIEVANFVSDFDSGDPVSPMTATVKQLDREPL